MTYPVDDSGNVRVDFVWGNFPLQPDENRGDDSDDIIGPNIPENRGWTGSTVYYASPLNTTEYVELSVGDQSEDTSWQDPDTRSVSVPTAHDIATTGYSNFPSFLPNYSGDGDTGLEVIMPNLIGLTESAASATLAGVGLLPSPLTSVEGATVANDGIVFDQEEAAGAAVSIGTSVGFITYQAPTVPSVVDFDSVAAATSFLEAAGLTVGTITTSTAGATSGNDGWIKSQSPVGGTKVDAGSAVNLVAYDYVAPATTGPISGFNRDASGTSWGSINGGEVIMYLVGQVIKPTAGDTITVTSTSNSTYNQTWTVSAVENNNSYNTGGTAVKLQYVSGPFTGDTSTGGTWTKI